MSVRELLRYEIWSKERSRRILVKTRKVLVRSGIVFGILVVVLGIILAIEIRWMMDGECKVASGALAEIDALQGCVLIGCNDFETKNRQAKETIEAAKRAAWTIRDKQAVLWLSIYLENVEFARRDSEIRAMMQKRGIHRSDKSLEFDKQSDELNRQIRFEYRSAVLKLVQ